jgi:hypothetical protein
MVYIADDTGSCGLAYSVEFASRVRVCYGIEFPQPRARAKRLRPVRRNQWNKLNYEQTESTLPTETQ